MHHIGDYVEILVRPDGATFRGILQDFNDDYVLINGYGFPCEDIITMVPA
jgi:hypothetical protein